MFFFKKKRKGWIETENAADITTLLMKMLRECNDGLGTGGVRHRC